jgi:hypothetical protein
LALHCVAAELSATGSSFDGSTPRHKKTFIMAKKFMTLLAGMAVIGGAATLFAQEGPSQQRPARGH